VRRIGPFALRGGGQSPPPARAHEISNAYENHGTSHRCAITAGVLETTWNRRNDRFKERSHRGHELCEVLRRRIKVVSVAECAPLSISDGFLRKSGISAERSPVIVPCLFGKRLNPHHLPSTKYGEGILN